MYQAAAEIMQRLDLEHLSGRLFGGKMAAPSIMVGQQKLVGFEKGAWNNMLDLAGYPKSGGKPAAK